MIKILMIAISPWLANVYDYSPAPGQFINEVPEIDAGATASEVLEIVKEQICGARTPGMVSLGSFGGSVTVGFDHSVVNVEGESDFAIYGNSMANGAEPGIVMVSADENCNGVPDDEWYELAGCLENAPGTVFNYSITYRRPAAGRTPAAHGDWKFVTDAEYIPWSDSEGATGHIMQIASHTQSYWPEWIGEAELSFSGTRLPDIASAADNMGTLWNVENPEWGYADSQPNSTKRWFDISDAVDNRRRPVKLGKIDFIRIYSATNQFRGWLGEASTEIAGGEDLHPDAEWSGIKETEAEMRCDGIRNGMLILACGKATPYAIIDMEGREIKKGELNEGINKVEVGALAQGIYLVKCEKVLKFVR